MPNKGPRQGFSLAEALVVLGVTSLLLILLFTVTGRSTHQGFRLADRALDAGEREVGTEALRSLLRGVRPPPTKGSGVFQGEAAGLVATVTPGRPVACADAPVPALQLRLDVQGGRTRLFCLVPGRPPALLLDLGPRPAGFSYATAGRPWTDRLRIAPSERASSGLGAPASSTAQRLWIRFASADGSIEVVEGVGASAPSQART